VINITKLENTRMARPAQWEGEGKNGEQVYIRYRWGYLELDVNGVFVYGVRYGRNYDGHMNIETMKELLKDHLYIEGEE